MQKKHLKDGGFMDELCDAKKWQDVAGKRSRCAYFTGGHGTMDEFPDGESLQGIIGEHFGSGEVVSAVRHSVGGLFNVRIYRGWRHFRRQFDGGVVGQEKQEGSLRSATRTQEARSFVSDVADSARLRRGGRCEPHDGTDPVQLPSSRAQRNGDVGQSGDEK